MDPLVRRHGDGSVHGLAFLHEVHTAGCDGIDDGRGDNAVCHLCALCDVRTRYGRHTEDVRIPGQGEHGGVAGALDIQHRRLRLAAPGVLAKGELPDSRLDARDVLGIPKGVLLAHQEVAHSLVYEVMMGSPSPTEDFFLPQISQITQI